VGVHPVLFSLPIPGIGTIPIFSYGVMLGLSFVVGWYLTLGLAERDGLPREAMANCFVVTALSAVFMARALYVLTNLDEFQSVGDLFALRSGGMVAYGGFLGGFVGSWAYLKRAKLPLVPWADVAVPSLASGLFLTRLGCYLYGCDFGAPLRSGAPGWLARLGTFPRWGEGATPAGSGSPAWAQHVAEGILDASAPTSLPVHPTQLYESALGCALLAILLVQRGAQRFRGQLFLSFTFLYGFGRFCLELLRDDAERGAVPPSLPSHWLIPGALALFAAGWGWGLASAIARPGVRWFARIVGVLPAAAAAWAMRPAAFAPTIDAKLSTSQFIGLVTGLLAAASFRALLAAAERNPTAAMALTSSGSPSTTNSAEGPA
jgi:phosphatidylglycerol:prolipoprotein diacylglycerol transferase